MLAVGPLSGGATAGYDAGVGAMHVGLWPCEFPSQTSGKAMEGKMTGHRKLLSLK